LRCQSFWNSTKQSRIITLSYLPNVAPGFTYTRRVPE
jgi:hypothetical protein